MCLAVPLRLTEVNGKNGIGERSGITRNVRLDFISDPKPGDYVLIHAGFAIERLDPDQARESIRAAKEVEDELASILENRA